MGLWTMIAVIAVAGIVFGCGEDIIKHLREMLRDRREHALEEMKIKMELDRRILGGDSAITENVAAELKSLREEVGLLREQVNQLSSKVETNNYIR